MEKHIRFSRPLHGFSLRSMLIATTLVAVVLGLAVFAAK
jgi:type II secretory pathway component PulJ